MIRFEKINTPTFHSREFKKESIQTPVTSQPPKEVEKLPDIKLPTVVNIPCGYTKLGIEKLDNGQEIHNYKLSNGLRVSILPMDTNTTVIRSFVNTGAINEIDSQRGISHFLEHMAFNGTIGSDGYKKLSTGDVFKLVGNIGGNTNAATNFALTDYYIQAPIFYDTDLEEIISIQGSMMNNLSLPESMIEKERGPVISEINMYTDYPEMLAYNTAIKNLYNIKTKSADYIAGSVENIKTLSRDDVLNYYRNNYYPANMYTTLAGDVEPDEAIKLIAKHFHSKVENPPAKKIDTLTPITEPIRRDIISPKTKFTHGFVMLNGPANNNLKDRLIVDLIAKFLFGNVNTKLDKHFIDTSICMDLGTEKVSTNPNDGQVIYFEYTANEDESEKALETLYKELSNFKTINDKGLNLGKQHLTNTFDRMCQNPEGILGLLGHSHFTSGDCSITQYKELINSITKEDVTRCLNTYFDLNKASIAVVHPKESEPETNNVNFTGIRKKQAIKPENIKLYTLGNNFEVVTYDTKSDYEYFKLTLRCENLPEQKLGTADVLNHMLNNGAQGLTREQFASIKSENLIKGFSYAYAGGLGFDIKANKDSIKKALALFSTQLLSPNLTEEALTKAKEVLRKNITNNEPASIDLILSDIIPENKYSYNDSTVLKNLDDITLDDVKKLYKDILKNSVAEVSFTTSENDTEYSKSLLKKICKFPRVKQKTYKTEDLYTPVEKSTVICHENNNAQADISIGYKYKDNGNLRDSVIFTLLTELLSKNSFNDLREKQQLAYRVNAFTVNEGAKNKVLFCNILTTTNDEETGEKTFENVPTSINGFNKLINDIKKGDFSDKDLEAVKLEFKARILDITDTDFNKADILLESLSSPYGILCANTKFNIIDSITKDEIINAANYIFEHKPTYGICANKETIEANQEYFNSLED